MGCRIFITMLVVSILQLHTLKALPLETAVPVSPVPPCTLQEAFEINQKHLQDGESRLNSIKVDTDDLVEKVREEINQLTAERTSAGKELLAGIQTVLDQEMQNKPESIDCLSAIQIQIDIVSAKANYNLVKCTSKTQKKGLDFENKILKVQQKAQAIQNKAVSSIGKCALSYYPYGNCADLDACCEIEKNKSLLKIDKYANKIKYTAEQIMLDVNECLTEAIEDIQRYILYINLNILNCSATEPIVPILNSEDSGESNELIIVPEGGNVEESGTETVAPQDLLTEAPQQSEEPQEPQNPEEPQGVEQPQNPQDSQTSEEPQVQENSQQPEEPQSSQAPQESQKPEETQQQPEPVVDQSGANQSGVDQSGGDQSGANQSGANQSGGDQSGANQSGGDQSVVDQSGVDQSSTNQSVVNQSEVDQSGVDQSAVDQSGANQGSSK